MNLSNPPEKPAPAKSPDSSGAASRVPGTIRLFTVSGIPVRLHVAFVLLMIWLAAVAGARTGQIVFLLGIVVSVISHDLGHALAAQRRGYAVRCIVLHPLRGLTTIEGNLRPRDELWVALAGPAANAALALLFAVVVVVTGESASLGSLALRKMTESYGLATRLCFANLFLVLFNLIPALPLDGGKALRALLVLRSSDRVFATRTVARVGLWIALIFGLVGTTSGNFLCAVVALFLVVGTSAEVRAEQRGAAVGTAIVEAAMVRQFATLRVGDSLGSAVKALAAASSQQHFPVLHGDQVAGIVSREALRNALAREGENAYVSGTMSRDVVCVRPADPLREAMKRSPNLRYIPTLVTTDDERLVGMLTAENLGEFLARQSSPAGPTTGESAEKQR